MSAEEERRLILHVSASMDGFVAGADGDIDSYAPRGEHGGGTTYKDGCTAQVLRPA